MNIRCAIVDDEPLAVGLMESYVKKTPFLELVKSYTNPVKAISGLLEEPVDLLFCDIQMPGLDGLELSRMLGNETRIIFTTAFSNYAIEGYKVNAVDYLLKPISYPDFLRAAKKAAEMIEQSHAAAEPASTSPDCIFIKSEHRLVKVKCQDITYIEGLKDYVKIHCGKDTEPILSLMTMKSLEEMLPQSLFLRVHKSYIVHIGAIDMIDKTGVYISQKYIPVSESNRSRLFEALAKTAAMPVRSL